MRLLPHWIQAISKNISADSKIRPLLSSVHITNTHVWATNSFIAIRAELPQEFISEKFPWENCNSIPDEWIIVPKLLIDDIKFKKNKNFDVIDQKAVIRTLTENDVSIVITDLDNEITYKSRIIKGKMPDLESFHKTISQSEKREEIAFKIEYMIDMLNTFKAMWHDNMRLSTFKENWIVLKPHDKNHDSWWLVMPLKI